MTLLRVLRLLYEIEARAKAATHAKPYAPYSATQAQDTLKLYRLLMAAMKVVEEVEEWDIVNAGDVAAPYISKAVVAFRTACDEVEK